MIDPDATPILVDDYTYDIRGPLGRYLRRQGLRTRPAANAAGGTRRARRLSHCLGEWSLLPVILLTAMAEQTARTVGLETSADDDLLKPSYPYKLLAPSVPSYAARLTRSPEWCPDDGVSQAGTSTPRSGRSRISRADAEI